MHSPWRSIRGSHNRFMLINGCWHRRVPADLDRSLQIGKNCRSRQTFENGDMLTSKLTRRKRGDRMAKRKAQPKIASPGKRKAGDRPRCGLCGKTGTLIKTDCCGNWICDDEHKYVLFSYARNSCHRNHSRYTLCAYHHNEGHAGDWKDCGGVATRSRPRCMCGTGQTSAISRNSRIPLHTNRPSAPSVD